MEQHRVERLWAAYKLGQMDLDEYAERLYYILSL